MDDRARQRADLLELLSALWDERLDAASRARLEELLSRNDFAAIDLLATFTRLHLDLEWLMSSKVAQERTMESLRRIHARSERRAAWQERLAGWQESVMSWQERWRKVGAIGLAASLLLIVACQWYFARPGIDGLVRPPQTVGEVVRLDNAGPGSGTQLRLGDAVVEGQAVEIRAGFARLSMGVGADVLLEGPCRARIVSGDRVALERGKLAVRAAHWATGFRVETNDVVATDLGTWFSVQSGDGNPSEIHVLEGQVRANLIQRNGRDGAAYQLRADEAVQARGNGEFEAIVARRDSVATRLTRFQPLRPIDFWNTGIRLDEGDPDPHWTVTAGSTEDGPYPQPAIVCIPHDSYGVNEPDRSQWISVDRGTTDGVPARSTYTFETTFDLTGFDPTTVWVSGLVLADDGVDEVWLNGKQLNIASWTDWHYGINYVKFHPISIRSGFVHGINRLSFVVKNESFIVPTDRGFDVPNTPNPMALRAEWQAFGRPTAATN